MRGCSRCPAALGRTCSGERLIEGLEIGADRWARVIHPTARISPLATIGYNVLLMAGVVVTSNAVIGNHVCVLPNTVIHHDARIGDWSLIGSNVTVAGNTSIGDNCYIGSGSSIMDGLTIGAGTLVGLGSTVIRSAARGQPNRRQPGAACLRQEHARRRSFVSGAGSVVLLQRVVNVHVRSAASALPATSFTRGSLAPPFIVAV